MNNDFFAKSILALVEAEKAQKAAERGHMSLGELASTLAATPDLPVRVDFGSGPVGVGDIGSYRGYYSDLAIEPGGDLSSHDLSKWLTAAVGQTFVGYKGGDFTMSRMTPVWVSSYGDASGLAVTGITSDSEFVRLEVTEEEW